LYIFMNIYSEMEKQYLDMVASRLGVASIDKNFIDGVRDMMYEDASVRRKMSDLNDKLLSSYEIK